MILYTSTLFTIETLKIIIHRYRKKISHHPHHHRPHHPIPIITAAAASGRILEQHLPQLAIDQILALHTKLS